jgi:hypothetical protein
MLLLPLRKRYRWTRTTTCSGGQRHEVFLSLHCESHVRPKRHGNIANSTAHWRRHSAPQRRSRSAQAIGQSPETGAARCCPRFGAPSDIDCIRERCTGIRPRYSRHHDWQLLDDDMARCVAGSVHKTLCPQLRRMHRNGSEKWFEIQRCLVVVQQSRFQELNSLHRKLAKASFPPHSAAEAIFVGRKAGMTSFANRSRSSSWTSRGVPSGVAHTTRSTPG